MSLDINVLRYKKFFQDASVLRVHEKRYKKQSVFLVNNYCQKVLCVCGPLIRNYISILFILLEQSLQSNISYTWKKLIPLNASRVLFFFCSWQQHIFWENTEKKSSMNQKDEPCHGSKYFFVFNVWQQRNSNPQPFSLYVNTKPFCRTLNSIVVT